jgi:hypothetical protein
VATPAVAPRVADAHVLRASRASAFHLLTSPVHRHTLVRPHRAIVHPRVPARPAMPAQRAPHPPQAQGAAVLLDSVLAPSSTPPSSVVQSAVSAVTTTAAAPVRAVAALAGPTLSALSHH